MQLTLSLCSWALTHPEQGQSCWCYCQESIHGTCRQPKPQYCSQSNLSHLQKAHYHSKLVKKLTGAGTYVYQCWNLRPDFEHFASNNEAKGCLLGSQSPQLLLQDGLPGSVRFTALSSICIHFLKHEQTRAGKDGHFDAHLKRRTNRGSDSCKHKYRPERHNS